MTEDVEEKPEVRYLSVVRKEGGEPIIGIPYREMSVDPDLVASFVLAVIIFENRQMKNFAKEGYVVVIEEGEFTVGLLIVDRVDDDTPFRNALKQVIEKFESKYEAQMIAWKGDIRPFREFAFDILQIYPYRTFSPKMIPSLLTKSDTTPDYQAPIPWSVGETDEKIQVVLGYINGKRSIEEIMAQSEFTDAEILAILSMLDKYEWITLTRKLEDASILIKIMEPSKFLVGVYGEQLTSIVEQCDGKKSLATICEELPYNLQAVKLVAKNLIDAGVLGYIDIDTEEKLLMPLDVSKVRYISLIRMEGGESVLNIPYAELTVDPDLIAGFVTAVIIFAKTPIRTIRKASYDILIQVGESVLVLLVVDPVPDEAPYRAKLQTILDEVETKHGDKLRHFEGDVRRFREFALTVIKEFPFQSADLNMVPVSRPVGGVRIPFRVGNVDHELEQVESFINGKRTIAEIMDLMGLTDEEVLALISILARYQWVEFKHRLTGKDVLVIDDCPKIVLDKLGAQYGEALDDLLGKFDGTATISEVIDSLHYDKDALWFLINKLVEVGCLKSSGSS